MSKELQTEVISGPATIESYADNLQQKIQVATLLLKSGMLPTHYRSPEAVLTAILYGRELGFSPIRALNSIAVINGKPTLEAQALKALAIQHGGKIKTIEWTNEKCTLEFCRGDWCDQVTYSMEDARLAGLTGKDNWKRMPKAMLYARCVSIGVRNMWADVLGGLYSAEEMRDAQAAPVLREVKPAQKAGPAFEVIDHETGEVKEDDLPPEWNIKPADAIEPIEAAIEEGDILALAAHKLTSRNRTNNMTVSEAWAKHEGLIRENLKKFNSRDRKVLEAYIAAQDEELDLGTGTEE